MTSTLSDHLPVTLPMDVDTPRQTLSIEHLRELVDGKHKPQFDPLARLQSFVTSAIDADAEDHHYIQASQPILRHLAEATGVTWRPDARVQLDADTVRSIIERHGRESERTIGNLPLEQDAFLLLDMVFRAPTDVAGSDGSATLRLRLAGMMAVVTLRAQGRAFVITDMHLENMRPRFS